LQRIEITTKHALPDAKGNSIKQDLLEDLGINASTIRTVKAFTINAGLNEEETNKIAKEAFSDPISQDCSVNSGLAKNIDFDFLVEIAFKTGVTDNEARTAKESIENFTGKKLNGKIHTSNIYLFTGDLTREDIERAVRESLGNSLIEKWKIWSANDWRETKEQTLLFESEPEPSESEVKEFDLNKTDRELEVLSSKMCLSLTANELKQFAAYFEQPKIKKQRKKFNLSKPTDVELECFAQTWSEHCKHKVFRASISFNENGKQHKISGLMKTFIAEPTKRLMEQSDFCVSVFHDNAGIIKFNEEFNIAFKVETHNSPSALDPYGGALTGIVGVNRDIMGTGLGAEPIFNTNVLCFGSPFTKELPKGVLHPKRIFKGVRKGIEHGGNQIGIPTINGSIFFDDSFTVRPLVYCGTGGLMPKKINGKPSHEKKALTGDKIVMLGGRIGKDGIHGATFSSTKLTENSPTSAVQIGAPIVQKKMQDMLLEARDLDLINSITDNGAGGISSSIGEMAEQSNGALVQLENAPLKYPGLQPWEIFLSEAQERMTVAISSGKIDEFLELAQRRGVKATVLGEFTDSGKLHVQFGDKTILYLDMEFLHNGLPPLELEAEFKQEAEELEKIDGINFEEELKRILSDLNVCSREWVVRQFDHEVQGTTAIKLLMGKKHDGPSDSGVFKPLADSPQGIVVSNGINPLLSRDGYHNAANSIDEAIRNCVASGANPEKIALLDNFCWPDPKFDREENPDGKKNLGRLVRACRACNDYSLAFGTPFISGKDSLSSNREIAGKSYSIKPTLLISALGLIEDVRRAISIDAKRAGDLVYVLGKTKPELFGSVFLQGKGTARGVSPKVNAEQALKLYKAVHEAIKQELIQSCHDLSQGGLAVALAETAFSGELGLKIELGKVPAENTKKDYQLLFSESASRFITTIKPENKTKLEKLLSKTDFAEIGVVTEEKKFRVTGLNRKEIINVELKELKKEWKKTLDW